MRDNFLDEEYEPYNQVYQHKSGNKIFLGDVTAAVQKIIIEKQKIGLVVTAAADMDHINFQPHIKHIRFDVFDSKSENLSKLFQRFYQLTESELQKTNILVHCFAGISRSATLVIAYLMKKHNWTFRTAITQVRKNRPKVLPNLGFERQLKDYERKLQGFDQSIERKHISKTSQSKKHTIKQTNLGLPELFGLGSTLTRSKMIEHVQDRPAITPITPGQTRRAINNLSRKSPSKNEYFPLAQKQPLDNRKIPLRSFRKKSISINRNELKPKQQFELYSRNGNRSNMRAIFGQKIALGEIKYATQKNIRHIALRQYNYGN